MDVGSDGGIGRYFSLADETEDVNFSMLRDTRTAFEEIFFQLYEVIMFVSLLTFRDAEL